MDSSVDILQIQMFLLCTSSMLFMHGRHNHKHVDNKEREDNSHHLHEE